jgi:ubiquinone biosynthesis protein UbiJ
LNEAPLGGKKATLGWPFSFLLNRLLDGQPAARERLAAFAGETFAVRNAPFPTLAFTILPGGRVEAGADSEPQVVVTLRPGALAVQGEHPLAPVLRELQHSFDAEEALSQVVGDIAAHRIAEAGRGLLSWQADVVRRLGESAADYLADEKGLLVTRVQMERFAAGVAELQDALERLEPRIARLG